MKADSRVINQVISINPAIEVIGESYSPIVASYIIITDPGVLAKGRVIIKSNTAITVVQEGIVLYDDSVARFYVNPVVSIVGYITFPDMKVIIAI